MTKIKHPTKREEKRLMDFTDKMDFLFAINNFDRSFTWKNEDKNTDDGKNILAEIIVSLPYQELNIAIYPKFWEKSLEEQREILLHEFCHLIPHPLDELAKDLMEGRLKTSKELKDKVEETTSRVAQLLDALLRDKNTYAKRAYKKYLI